MSCTAAHTAADVPLSSHQPRPIMGLGHGSAGRYGGGGRVALPLSLCALLRLPPDCLMSSSLSPVLTAAAAKAATPVAAATPSTAPVVATSLPTSLPRPRPRRLPRDCLLAYSEAEPSTRSEPSLTALMVEPSTWISRAPVRPRLCMAGRAAMTWGGSTPSPAFFLASTPSALRVFLRTAAPAAAAPRPPRLLPSTVLRRMTSLSM
mmetsp:Transcript_37349/g.83113  ORF Transcript_37349/g.83113 Transcript_37349/m.83113 type:complete len:206 (-) Transcript_37349:1254-1871(-)